MSELKPGGIDNGMGKSNVDPDTGIRYGVISSNSLMPEAASDIWTEGAVYLPYCPHCHECMECDSNTLSTASVDKCPSCGKDVEEWDIADEPNYIEYHETTPDGEIIIIDCLDNDYMIIKSPYVCRGMFCSPCVPGAVDLDSSNGNDGVFAYCLPDDFFEDGRAPYNGNYIKLAKGE